MRKELWFGWPDGADHRAGGDAAAPSTITNGHSAC
jgi:hypothetical protein